MSSRTNWNSKNILGGRDESVRECGADISERYHLAKWCVPCAEDRQRTTSKVYGLRVPARSIRVLEKAIRKSGHSQSEFSGSQSRRLARRGGIEASAFAAGRSAGHDDVGHLIPSL